MNNKFSQLLKKNIIFLDGAMGTMLQDGILPPGFSPELLNLTVPDKIRAVHEKYLAAGADIIYTNTFGANKYKVPAPYTPEELINAAVKIAVSAAKPYGAAVALSLGSTGQMFISFDELYNAFKPLVISGEKAGADIIVFETISDLIEMRAAVLAAKENTDLPVMATMTFEKNARTFTGCSAVTFAQTISALGVDAIGMNCSLGPNDVVSVVKEICENTSLPVIVKPNAGLPDQCGYYNIDNCLFSDYFEPILNFGVKFIGGCCGSNPDYIRELKKRYVDFIPPEREYIPKSIVCSSTKVIDLDFGLKLVGERLNPTGKKKMTAAIIDGNMDYVLAQASEQTIDGADVLDINVGVSGINEAETMAKVVTTVQEITSLPLQIDSSDPKAIEAGLRAFNGVAIINSVNGKPESLEAILPISKKYGAFVVGLCLDEAGIPQTAKERIEIAKRIMTAAEKHGIPKHKLIIDCLTLTVSAQQEQAVETLKAIRTVREELGLKTLLGVSNISFGLPDRPLINTTFLVLAVQAGLNLAIINPSTTETKETVAALKVLLGEDRDAGNYIDMMAKDNSADESDPLKLAVIKGLAAEAADLTIEALKVSSAEAIIKKRLIPALDTVGAKFERGVFFLPQLISSANAAEAAFNVIKNYYKSSGSVVKGKGTIVICTVKGDIHDIGKNIVRTLLENYGYDVIDLGRDVSAEAVVEAVIEHDAKLAGLSALMTTTITSMEATIKMLREKTPDTKIMIGGAVITNEVANRIGADFYAADAKQAVDIARKIFG
ncbi:MAG: hypothetical protein A2Y17_06145 [Clostridiales bacterium GWF2_38_85]|nr:MAG: hypothetical protein A2Y17_06145 [Clostridiales bacterium GWF2_38_85]HBL85473.1 homocysteine methyltransferase [Clostridiales bacterium]